MPTPDRDPRYGTFRWRRLSKQTRTGARCYVPGCSEPVKAADHVVAVYPGMPDSQFYDPGNLRPSCFQHNVRRGVAARLERETADGVADQPRPSSIYARRPSTPSGALSHELHEPWRPGVAYHRCVGGMVTGYMTAGRPMLPSCPPGCRRAGVR